MPVESCDAMSELLWAKLQLNLSNAVNALADIPLKTMLEDHDYRRIMAMLMKELLAVASAKGIVLPKLTALPASWVPRFMSLPNVIFKMVGQQMVAVDPTVRLSMWWDLSQGKTTEVNFLNGAVVEHGKAIGLECPANAKIVDMIHAAEQGELSQGIDAKTMLAMLRND